MELKNLRDSYVHRLGETGMGGKLGDQSIVFDGFAKYLAFWACGSDSPFLWDGREGNGFYVGLADIPTQSIVALFAPMPGSFTGPVDVADFGLAEGRSVDDPKTKP